MSPVTAVIGVTTVTGVTTVSTVTGVTTITGNKGSVSLQLSNGRLSTLDYGLVNGKRNQEDPVKCAKTRVIITHIFTSRFDNLENVIIEYLK